MPHGSKRFLRFEYSDSHPFFPSIIYLRSFFLFCHLYIPWKLMASLPSLSLTVSYFSSWYRTTTIIFWLPTHGGGDNRAKINAQRADLWLSIIQTFLIPDHQAAETSTHDHEIRWRSHGYLRVGGHLGSYLKGCSPTTTKQSPRMWVREPTTTVRVVLPHCHCFLSLFLPYYSQRPEIVLK